MQKQKAAGIKIAAAYVLAAAAWILLSDSLLAALVEDERTRARWQLVKGLSFVFITALVLYRVVKRDVAALLRASDALRESEELYRFLTENTGDLITLYDVNGRRVYASPSCHRLLGQIPEETFGGVHPEDLRAVREAWQRVLTGEQSFIVFRHAHADGSWRWLEASASLVHYLGQPHVIIVTRDVTERRRAEEALRRKQQDYEVLVNSIDGIVWELDVETRRFTFVSEQAERLLGYPVHLWLEEENFWAAHLDPADREWAVAFCREATLGGHDHEFEYRMIAADGRTVWMRDIITVVHEGGRPAKLRGVMIDTTNRKRAEAARAELQNRLASVEEEERRRIAADLHDRMGDELSRAKLQIERLKELAGERPELREGVAALESLGHALEREVRHLVWEIRPPALDKFGLVSALEDYVADWSASYSVEADFQSTGFDAGERLPQHVETTLYRVAQEALTNVRRHAAATRVGVLLIRSSDEVRLIVEDDGRGCEVCETREQTAGARKFGLTGMSERAELAGGTFVVESAPGKGCTIFVNIPLAKGGRVENDREETARLSG